MVSSSIKNQSESSSSSDYDDDFTRLDSAIKHKKYQYHHTPTDKSKSSENQTEYLSFLPTSTAFPIVDLQQQHHQQSSTQHTQSKPFLPQAAEAELYQLATNFLLYVAMVLIITLVARIYFPEAARVRTRSYSSPISSPTLPALPPLTPDRKDSSSPSSSDDNHNTNNTSDFTFQDSEANHHHNTTTGLTQPQEQDPQEDQEQKNEWLPLVPPKPFTATTNSSLSTSKKKKKKKKKNQQQQDQSVGYNIPLPHSPPLIQKHSSVSLQERFSNTFLFESETESHKSTPVNVLKRLLFCAISLNVTFVIWGLVQERMLTRKYPRFVGEYFTYSYALVFTNRCWTFILSSCLLYYLKPHRSQTTVIYEYSFPSISNMLSSWCQYESLKYVSFPAATLFKSFKLAPVMAMGVILGNKKYPLYDYIVALFIGIGITMFMSSTDDLNVSFRYNTYEHEQEQQQTLSSSTSTSSTLLQHTNGAVWTGVMLLLLFLFFDSFTSQWQSRMFQRHVDLSMVELIFATSAYSTLLSFITLVHTHELIPAIQFMYRHSEIHIHFFIFSICSTIGQILIFYTIKNFGAVVFTIIMTIRILTSIGLSVILYDHQITTVGFFGLVTVMTAIGYRIKRQAENSNLIKWKGMDDQKAFSLVREWHEHVDM